MITAVNLDNGRMFDIYAHRVVSVLRTCAHHLSMTAPRFYFIIAICVSLIFNTVNGVDLSAGNLYVRDDHTRFIPGLSERERCPYRIVSLECAYNMNLAAVTHRL